MTANKAIVEIRKVFGQNLKKLKNHVFFSAKKLSPKNCSLDKYKAVSTSLAKIFRPIVRKFWDQVREKL